MLNELENRIIQEYKIPQDVIRAIPELYRNYQESLVSAAITAEKRGEHWDEKRPVKMHVGCSLLVLGEKLDLSQPAIYTGSNTKKRPGDFPYPERKCSEMNALENVLGIEYSGKIKAEKFEEMEDEDLGFIAAIVTVSEAHNTGERDTADHDVVYPCKQCYTNYKFLLKKGLVSEETIIFNARIENGEVRAGQPMPLADILEKFESGEEERNLHSIKQLLEVKQKALEEYRTESKNIAAQYPPLQDLSNQKTAHLSRWASSRRELVEAIMEEKGEYTDKVVNALKSASEEGASKQRLLDSLGHGHLPIDMTKKSFSQEELDLVRDALALELRNLDSEIFEEKN